MAIDPPYRLDPFQNIVGVRWKQQQPPWWNPQPYDFVPICHCTYEQIGGTTSFRGLFDGPNFASGEPLPNQEQIQEFPYHPSDFVTSAVGNISGNSASIRLTDYYSDKQLIFNFDLSDIYPQYGQACDPFEWSVSSPGGGQDVYMISYRYAWNYGSNPPHEVYHDFWTHNGTLAIGIPTTRTLELVSWHFIRHDN